MSTWYKSSAVVDKHGRIEWLELHQSPMRETFLPYESLVIDFVQRQGPGSPPIPSASALSVYKDAWLYALSCFAGPSIVPGSSASSAP
eukprot:3413365-Amphidinium_carterae.1